jgi:uncharacterized protein
MDVLEKWKEIFETYLCDNVIFDGSHDIGHSRRVWKNAINIMPQHVDKLVVLAGSYFHDIVSFPKNHPNRSRSSIDAANKAEEILITMNFPIEKIENVKHCIEAHSFSAKISPRTIEAKIIQDADRMEALGAIGLARTFYVAGKIGSDLFDDNDPMSIDREPNDKKYALDHFKVKLLKLSEKMHTAGGKIEAERRTEILTNFIKDLNKEL